MHHKESQLFNEDTDWYVHHVHLITTQEMLQTHKRSTTQSQCHFHANASLTKFLMLFIALLLVVLIFIVYYYCNRIVYAITVVFMLISISTKSP